VCYRDESSGWVRQRILCEENRDDMKSEHKNVLKYFWKFIRDESHNRYSSYYELLVFFRTVWEAKYFILLFATVGSAITLGTIIVEPFPKYYSKVNVEYYKSLDESNFKELRVPIMILLKNETVAREIFQEFYKKKLNKKNQEFDLIVDKWTSLQTSNSGTSLNPLVFTGKDGSNIHFVFQHNDSISGEDGILLVGLVNKLVNQHLKGTIENATGIDQPSIKNNPFLLLKNKKTLDENNPLGNSTPFRLSVSRSNEYNIPFHRSILLNAFIGFFIGSLLGYFVGFSYYYIRRYIIKSAGLEKLLPPVKN
jgi:hypothetical protein